MKKIVFAGHSFGISYSQYKTGETAILVVDPITAERELTATSWIEGLEKDEVAIKDYSENEGMLAALLEAKIVRPPHRFLPSGWVSFPVCRLAGD